MTFPGELPAGGFSAAVGCVGLMDHGFLAVSQRIVGDSGLYPYDSRIYARAHDRLGVPWALASAVGEPQTVSPYEQRCAVATGGDRALLVYQDGQTRDQLTYRLMARVVDGLGRPLGSGPIDLSVSAPVGVNGAPWLYHAPVWDGERFVVFWAPAFPRNNLLMSVIHPDGTPGTPTSIVVTDDVDGDSHQLQEIEAVWTGDHFVLFFDVDILFPEQQDLRTLRVSRDGLPFGLANVIPIDGRGAEPRMAVNEDRIGMLWLQRRAGEVDVRAGFLDLDGNFMDPPGMISVWNRNGVQNTSRARLAWTGEQFGAAVSVPDSGSSNYNWYFWRFLPDGTLLDPTNPVLLTNGVNLRHIQDLHWAGRDFWLFVIRSPGKLERHRIGCSCQDEDGDFFDACDQFDCDDQDPLTNPFALEACRGLRDENCNGFVDCDDASCPGGPGPGASTTWNGPPRVWRGRRSRERNGMTWRGVF